LWPVQLLAAGSYALISLEQNIKEFTIMSISLATMGMFNSCCGTRGGGGGAPPYRQNANDIIKPRVLVKNVEMETKNSIEDYLDKIKVKLIDFDEDE
jgi:hypothetical protein